jgi:hypothetical protein
MKSFKQYTYSLPYYPVQIDPKQDDGEWITGDPPMPIEITKQDMKTILKQADRQVVIDRKTRS